MPAATLAQVAERERAIAHLKAHMPKPNDRPLSFGVERTPEGWKLTDLTMADAKAAASGDMDGLLAALERNVAPRQVSTVAVWEKPEPEHTAPVPTTPKQQSSRSRLRVEKLYAEYMAYEQGRAARGELHGKKVSQITTRLRPFLEHFKGRALNDLTTFDMEQYARELAYYPTFIDKIPAAKALQFDAIVEQSKAGKMLNKLGEPAPTITESTHSGYINDAVNFVDYCRRRNLASHALIEGLRSDVPNLREGVKRRAFVKDEMQKIFNSAYYRERRYNVSYQYWVPLIAAFTGARVNEIAQLRPTDIKQDDEGLWYFDITTTDDDGKSLKNEASKRIVPVHSQLLELQLVEYAKSKQAEGAANLFNIEPERADKHGRAPARWFNEDYLRDYLDISDKAVVFHSFRHRFITSMHQAIFDASDVKGELIASTTPALIMRRMVGHSDLSIMTAGRSNDVHTDTYTGTLSIKSMKRVIDLLEYPGVIFHGYTPPKEGVVQRMRGNDLLIDGSELASLLGKSY